MHNFIAGFVVGGASMFMLGKLFGQSLARALRAWRDMRATQKAIRGLLRKAVEEWRHMAKVAFWVVAVAVAIGWWVVVNA